MLADFCGEDTKHGTYTADIPQQGYGEKRDVLEGGVGFDRYCYDGGENWGHHSGGSILLTSVIPKLDHISDSDGLGKIYDGFSMALFG